MGAQKPWAPPQTQAWQPPPAGGAQGAMGGGTQGATGGQSIGANIGGGIGSMLGNQMLGGLAQNVIDSKMKEFGSGAQLGAMFTFLRLHRLRYYFHVDNRYVLKKLQIILFPFVHKKWERSYESMDAGAQFKAPMEDHNAPDLYIPTMAFMTYILLMGYTLGTFGQFTPEVIGVTASSTLFALALEVAIAKLGFYLVGATVRPPVVCDLIALSGYKYVSMIVMMILGLAWTPGYLFYSGVLFFGGGNGFFFIRSLRMAILQKPAETLPNQSMQDPHATQRQNYFLITMGALQLIFSYFMIRTVTLGPVTEVINQLHSNVGKAAIDLAAASTGKV